MAAGHGRRAARWRSVPGPNAGAGSAPGAEGPLPRRPPPGRGAAATIERPDAGLRLIPPATSPRRPALPRRRLVTALAALVLVAAIVGTALVLRPEDGPTVGDRSGVAPTSWMLLRGSDDDLERDLDLIADSGASWIRFDFEWTSAEPEQGRYDWAAIDRVVRAAHERDLRVLATLAYTPKWARPPGATSDKFPPKDPSTFAAFAEAAARRYAPRGVHHWEIWNEPNIVQFWAPQPDPQAYAELLRGAASAIRAADREATILSGGLSPSADREDGRGISPRTFLGRLYDAGARPDFDAVGMHPYAFPYGVRAVGEWNQFQTMPATHRVLVDRGDGHKKIWMTEFGAPTGTADAAVTEAQQVEMIRLGWEEWSRWDFAGPMFWYSARDSGDDEDDVEENFGLVHRDHRPKAGLREFRRVMARPDDREASGRR